MKKFLYLIPLSLFIACSGGADKVETNKSEESTTNTEQKVENCTYAYDNSKTTVLWEAYKFTERAAVGGKMDSIVVSNVKESNDALKVVENASFEVYTSSVNSENSDRDMKIQKYFFGNLQMPEKITGKVLRWEGATAGKAYLEISMNGITKEMPFEYELSDKQRVKLTGQLDVTEFQAGNAIAALNKICKELHTGSDGKSKLWPDFKITVVTDLIKSGC
ncbi:MAG: YceI family protein [Luteibaculum sp.]